MLGAFITFGNHFHVPRRTFRWWTAQSVSSPNSFSVLKPLGRSDRTCSTQLTSFLNNTNFTFLMVLEKNLRSFRSSTSSYQLLNYQLDHLEAQLASNVTINLLETHLRVWSELTSSLQVVQKSQSKCLWYL